MASPRISLKNLKQVLALVERYKLDSIEIEGLKLTKSRHLFSKEEIKQANPAAHSFQGEPTSIDELDALLGIGSSKR